MEIAKRDKASDESSDCAKSHYSNCSDTSFNKEKINSDDDYKHDNGNFLSDKFFLEKNHDQIKSKTKVVKELQKF